MQVYFFLVDKKLQLFFTFLIGAIFLSNFQFIQNTFGGLATIEKQPIFVVIVCILIYIHYLQRGGRFLFFLDNFSYLSYTQLSLLCLLFIIITIFFIDTVLNGWGDRFGLLLRLLLGPLVYLLLSIFQISFHKKTLRILVFFLFLVGVILHFKIPVLNTYLCNFLEISIPRYIAPLGDVNRGIRLFASEPALAAMQLMLLYIVVDLSFSELKEKFFLLSLILLLFFWNKSATGYMLLSFYYLPHIIRKEYFLKILFGLLFVCTLSLVFQNNRIFEIFINIRDALFSDPQGVNYGLIGNLLYYEFSQGVRIASLLLAGLHTLLYPFGHGLETRISIDLFNEFPILPWSEIFRFITFENASFHMHAYVQTLLLSIGLFSVLLIVFLFCCYYFSSIKNTFQKNGILLIIFVLLFFQAGVDPIPWVLCAILHRYQFDNHNTFRKINL